MSISHKSAILVWIAFFLSAGCTGGQHVGGVDDPPHEPQTDQIEPTVQPSPDDVREAELLALCISETLYPAPELADGIMFELQAIRTSYGQDVVHRTRARDHWTGVIEIQFDDAAAHDFGMGSYYHWNEMNNELGPVRVAHARGNVAELHFSRTINPCLAAEMYMELPGVVEAIPVFVETDGPDIFVGMSEWHGYTYLFRYARNDCEHGCRDVEFYYFRFEESTPVLMGIWDPDGSDLPAWWSQVESEWIECSCAPSLLTTPQSEARRDRMQRGK